jgi:hypothetical protein
MLPILRHALFLSLCLASPPLLFTAACGAPPAPQTQPTRLQKTDGRTTVTVELVEEGKRASESGERPPTDPRSLPLEADFGRLVEAANQAEEYDLHQSQAGCLLGRSDDRTGKVAGGWKLAADLAAAVRPLPSAPVDLEKRLRQKPGRVHVLTRWGRIGEEPFDIALVAFTTTTPASVRLPAVALLQTDAGIFVRQSDRVSERYQEPFSLDDLGPLLAERAASGPFVIYVTAAARVRLDRVRELLAYLPERENEVALAVPLAAGTRLPAPPAPSRDPSLWCPDGLPAPAADAVEGDIDQQAVRRALAPLSEGARKCMASVSGEAAAGGKVMLALRIGAGGKVENVCLTRDEIKNALLARCLAETARGLAFPAPDPAGQVDIHLPLRLAPTGFRLQRALCR